MKKLLLLIAATGCILTAFTTIRTEKPVYTKKQIERGRYLVQIMGCRDCHSPKIMTPQGPAIDVSRDLSGHPSDLPTGNIDKESLKDWVLFNGMSTAAVGPWGISYSANLSSDETGIGNWTEEQFLIALTEGKSKGIRTARPLLPPMPWQNYVNIEKADAVAMFAYLKSTVPVKNVVPQPVPLDKM